jgi:hypothetical protein
VDPKAGLNNVEKRKFLTPPGLELRPLRRPARSQSLLPLFPAFIYTVYMLNGEGARGSVVGCGTVLQAGRSRVRIPLRSLDFSVDLTLPAVLSSWG